MRARITCQTILTVTLVLGSIAWGAQMPQYITSDKDLRSALKAARTPEDHELIAAYCQVKADRLDAKAEEFEQAAESFRSGPVVKNLTAPNTASRYEATAKKLHQEAQSTREMAASHQHIADTVENAGR